MTTTTVSDAVIIPQSQGTGLSSEAAPIDAGLMGVMARFRGDGAYVDTLYAGGIAFQNHDGSNNTVEVAPGAAWVTDGESATDGKRASDGSPKASIKQPPDEYNIDLPGPTYYLVVFPTAVTIDVSSGTLNAVHIDLDVGANNGVAIEHDDASAASPGATSLKIGETNPDDASADTRANDDAQITARTLSANSATADDVTANDSLTDPASVSHGGELADDGDTQPPETHDNAAHSSSYTTTNENVENFQTGGGSGTVPTSQGDGTLAMELPALSVTTTDEEANRALNTQYTNNTGGPLYVHIITEGSGGNLHIDGTSTYSAFEGNLFYGAFVPDGSTYELVKVGGVSIQNWVESELSA
jgi:hypothetical protein